MGDPPAGAHGDTRGQLVFRRGKLRKREDDEVRMMREALTSLDDLPRVKRLLLELGRFYNPVTDRPVLGMDVRRAVVTSLEQGNVAAARARLELALAEYLRMDESLASRAADAVPSPDAGGAA
jgi:hypothetical protein